MLVDILQKRHRFSDSTIDNLIIKKGQNDNVLLSDEIEESISIKHIHLSLI